jgi:hypothetical protein
MNNTTDNYVHIHEEGEDNNYPPEETTCSEPEKENKGIIKPQKLPKNNFKGMNNKINTWSKPPIKRRINMGKH